jgi:hypothetical protein
MRKRKITAAGLVLVLAIFISSCAAKHPIQPSTANNFDSDSHNVLMATDNLIKTTGQDLTTGKYPPGMDTNVKDALNSLIRAYNEADKVYRAYHDAVMAGTVTPSQQAAVTSELSNVSKATNALKAAKVSK